MRGANPRATERSRRLRRASTDAERKLWYRLRSRSIDGFKFVRQEPIGPYVADFVCRERQLIVEVDGSQHLASKRDIRDQWLVERCYKVLRFWNNDVLTNIDGVLEAIARSLWMGVIYRDVVSFVPRSCNERGRPLLPACRERVGMRG